MEIKNNHAYVNKKCSASHWHLWNEDSVHQFFVQLWLFLFAKYLTYAMKAAAFQKWLSANRFFEY